MLQLEHHPLARRESLHGTNDAAPQLAAGHVAFRAGTGPLIRNTVQDLFFLAVGGDRGGQVPITRRSLSQVIETQIGDDTVDPGIERALKPEAAYVHVSAEEGFLIDVLAVFLRTS